MTARIIRFPTRRVMGNRWKGSAASELRDLIDAQIATQHAIDALKRQSQSLFQLIRHAVQRAQEADGRRK